MIKGLEYVKNQIAKLKDDLQHYTMVEKDSVLASQIRYDLEQFETIEEELKDQRKRLTIISEILVDISKGNYSDLKLAIKEIREVLD